jgi:alkanesulfonate monooxygenase SsuD/methylene tetrahydromethanopterin reductase-like flavin-dependent oxidoreductase (luciferase family)
MTNGSSDRRDRIESLIEGNARSIQALTDDITELKLIVAADHEQARQERQELRQAMIGVANLLSSLDSDRPNILRKLNTIEDKVDRILSRGDGGQPQP